MASTWMHAAFSRLITARRSILLATAIAAMVATFGLLRLQSDNSPEVFFVDGSPAVERYARFQELFGTDQSLRLALTGDSVWSAAGLAWLKELELAIVEVDGVRRVTGLHEHHRRHGWPPKDIEAFRQQAMSNDLDRAAGWISRDGSIVSVLAQLEAMSPPTLETTLDDLDRLIADPPDGISARWLGLPILNQTLDRSAREIGGL